MKGGTVNISVTGLSLLIGLIVAFTSVCAPIITNYIGVLKTNAVEAKTIVDIERQSIVNEKAIQGIKQQVGELHIMVSLLYQHTFGRQYEKSPLGISGNSNNK